MKSTFTLLSFRLWRKRKLQNVMHINLEAYLGEIESENYFCDSALAFVQYDTVLAIFISLKKVFLNEAMFWHRSFVLLGRYLKHNGSATIVAKQIADQHTAKSSGRACGSGVDGGGSFHRGG